MPRGGRRSGTQGKAYTNRTDLNRNRQPVQVAAGQPYGERAAQEQAQRALPLPAAPPVPATPPGPAPGTLGAFTRPTDYPDEPVTAGMPFGPGPGQEALVGGYVMDPDDEVLAELQGLYRASPNSDLLRLIERARGRKGT